MKEAGKCYKKAGVPYIRVTSILDDLGFYDGIKYVDPVILELSSQWGRAVHEMIALALKDNLDAGKLSPQLAGALDSVMPIVHKILSEDEPLLIEETLFSNKGFAGTPDLFTMNGVLIDFKTSTSINTAVIPQIGAYSILLQENGYTPNKGVVIWANTTPDGDIHKTVTRVKNVDLEYARRTFQACLDVYHSKKKSPTLLLREEIV